jgi:hypothetical protein
MIYHTLGAVVDALGTVYVADYSNNLIRAMTVFSGTGRTLVGNNGNRESLGKFTNIIILFSRYLVPYPPAVLTPHGSLEMFNTP